MATAIATAGRGEDQAPLPACEDVVTKVCLLADASAVRSLHVVALDLCQLVVFSMPHLTAAPPAATSLTSQVAPPALSDCAPNTWHPLQPRLFSTNHHSHEAVSCLLHHCWGLVVIFKVLV